MILSIQEISKLLHVNNLAAAGTASITSVEIDSRRIEPGALFIALSGAHQDGRIYVEESFKKGAKAAIIGSSDDGFELLAQKEHATKYGCALFVVDDPLKALHILAKWHLQKFPNLKKIAITGSSGKTTVKNLLYSIFSQAFHTHATAGNFNSETGLPLSIFHIEGSHQVTILEMGMNHAGEIADLAQIVEPDIAIITNIGKAHIGFLESVEAIALEKKAIFSRFDGNQLAFIPQKDAYASLLAQNVQGNVIFYDPATIKRLENITSLGLDGWRFSLGAEEIHFRLPGIHNFENAALAIYVAKEMGIKHTQIKQGLQAIRAGEHRNEVIKGTITVMKDCYNANPESMKAAIELITALKYSRKVLFLAEMKELGAMSASGHKELAQPIMHADVTAIFLLGKEMLFLERELKVRNFTGMIFCDSNFDTLKAHLKLYLKASDLLLIKGSRAHRLERLVTFLEEEKFLPKEEPSIHEKK
ncbi:UDP-N-acetylmuramoyl-tripeptide--D-alanyl-D-alanine ligase [Entomospira culicis]|uniref:UDP-N-acetylmuramoyl-tripeptide--D-alanyl-D-alanine ligase n=1 Tax=Entomospira culicis TaxID=2719989 RepID=A0A968GFP3_9SPIO|nr:UDP-N-acetylmuramoyl-tripeptide--D-alanyl-D-alanine ligase [Entomospira culicis]NIZ19447.1 UDP-N-acetylmuramoyl-tripeptide--D-alanyl-D-alanine ligase [Entomospira culicis]NIZ69648.1 UDP-N-acetylmuramoyl-tripeptide--D-alanyl-D-alanine ligase [Entomospira culicis]WDI36759.1 UDP-N-acetylmuramoyl-tripeptide--D-alanyl-D-alanine ligase [Entomospira culicis]WDI38388.1 UDP-N-acetylmuramoyl-tripeptide--D-alanyl-D-alanine ligase [Entomospira culicis]